MADIDSTIPMIKIMVVGDAKSGKTALINRMALPDYKFHDEYIPTVFDNYNVEKQFTVNEQQSKVAFGMWDTAGDEVYDRLRPLSYPQTDVALICFERFDIKTLRNVADKWHSELAHHLPELKKYILVATKMDIEAYLYDHELLVYGYIRQLRFDDLNILDDIIEIVLHYERIVLVDPDKKIAPSESRIRQYTENPVAQQDIDSVMALGFSHYMETSALTGDGIAELEQTIFELHTFGNKTHDRKQQSAGGDKCGCTCL